MKIVKMSLAAAMLMGASAFAVDNIQVSGDANVFYSTTDMKGLTSNAIKGETDGTLFDKDSSAADASVNLNITADLLKNDMVSISAGAGYTVISTLGLENNFVSNVWGGSHTAVAPNGANYGEALGGAKVENANWFTEAYVVATVGKTTAKVGRMALDTPLAFTETWTVEKNTFEGAAVINQDLPDTTVVVAWVGNGNGTETFGVGGADASNLSNVYSLGLAAGGVVNANGDFATYGTDGAYAAGIINNSLEMLTVQAWYYDVTRLATAYWLQADLSMSGIMAGVQYSGITIQEGALQGAVADDVDSSATGLMLGYEMKDVATIKASYSMIGEDHSAGFNTATQAGTAQSKLYTEAWWNFV